MTVNDTEYTVLRLLGKGKGGYSYLVTDGEREYVLKQIHHEPCEYYTFGDKLQSELRDYETLRALGIPLPRLLAVDKAQERLLKEYIAGPTVAELRESGRMDGRWTEQVRAMCAVLYPAGLNIDYYPTNFVPRHGQIHADLTALALKVGAQTGDDLFLYLGGNVRAEHLADADDVLRRPGLLLRLQRELAAGDMAHRALRRGRIAFMNVTANRANPLFHNKILHQINFSLCCFYYRPLRSSGRCRKMSEPRSAPRRAFRR